ncbi:hypothetical protein TNCV_3385011 [Trichonephila clavipes]|uniref:Uncharacterized protein n=1 Tax=Trichonephila clavipes TaxID=2585209 RepID=A0A8X6VQM1_TRICX|nr:hypothetical protein TNCV_3385011 [Trichonephila clavipes]
MIAQFRNVKVSNHGSIPITIDCNVVAFIVFEEGFHQPIKRTKQSNQIEFLPDDIFSDMPHLNEVVLSNNKISIVKEAPFTVALKILHLLILENNPINCNCDFAWITKIDHKNIRGRCQEPEFRKGKPLQDLDVKDFGFCLK